MTSPPGNQEDGEGAALRAVDADAVLFVARKATGNFVDGQMNQATMDNVQDSVRRYLTAYHDWLKSSGLAIVPVVSSLEMVAAGEAAFFESRPEPEGWTLDMMRQAYRAMLRAAPNA